jgi:hypothetical protein
MIDTFDKLGGSTFEQLTTKVRALVLHCAAKLAPVYQHAIERATKDIKSNPDLVQVVRHLHTTVSLKAHADELLVAATAHEEKEEPSESELKVQEEHPDVFSPECPRAAVDGKAVNRKFLEILRHGFNERDLNFRKDTLSVLPMQAIIKVDTTTYEQVMWAAVDYNTKAGVSTTIGDEDESKESSKRRPPASWSQDRGGRDDRQDIHNKRHKNGSNSSSSSRNQREKSCTQFNQLKAKNFPDRESFGYLSKGGCDFKSKCWAAGDHEAHCKTIKTIKMAKN